MGHRALRRHGAADEHHTRRDHPMRLRFVVLALLLATPLRAQTGSASDVMATAVRAYRDLEFDRAASLLRRVLAPPPPPPLDGTPRAPGRSHPRAPAHHRAGPRPARAAVLPRLPLRPHHRAPTLRF